MEQPMTIGSSNGHLLPEIGGLPEALIAMSGERWISTDEEDVAFSFRRSIEWSDEFIPDFDVKPVSRLLYSTRDVALLKANGSVENESYLFEQLGNNCSAKIVLELCNSILNMTVSLLDIGGRCYCHSA